MPGHARRAARRGRRLRLLVGEPRSRCDGTLRLDPLQLLRGRGGIDLDGRDRAMRQDRDHVVAACAKASRPRSSGAPHRSRLVCAARRSRAARSGEVLAPAGRQALAVVGGRRVRPRSTSSSSQVPLGASTTTLDPPVAVLGSSLLLADRFGMRGHHGSQVLSFRGAARREAASGRIGMRLIPDSRLKIPNSRRAEDGSGSSSLGFGIFNPLPA